MKILNKTGKSINSLDFLIVDLPNNPKFDEKLKVLSVLMESQSFLIFMIERINEKKMFMDLKVSDGVETLYELRIHLSPLFYDAEEGGWSYMFKDVDVLYEA